MDLWTRRKFFLASLASSFAAGAGKVFGRTLPADGGALPTPASLAPAAGDAADDYL